jgi:hypothetical protein
MLMLISITFAREQSELNPRSCNVVRANRSQTVHEVAAEGIIHGSCHKILFVDLNVSVTHQCSMRPDADQHRDRMSTCSDLINNANRHEMFLNKVITGDRAGCLFMICNLGDNWPTGTPHHHQERRDSSKMSKGREMLELFFFFPYLSEVVYMEFMPEGVTVSKHMYTYKEILCCLCSLFHLSTLSLGAERTGCSYTTVRVHIALCLSQKNWQINGSQFCHTLDAHPDFAPWEVSIPF